MTHLPVLVLNKDREQRWPGEGQGGLLVCLYPTVLEEDARLALGELERTALLQTLLKQTVGTEAGEGLREAGKGVLGLWVDSIASKFAFYSSYQRKLYKAELREITFPKKTLLSLFFSTILCPPLRLQQMLASPGSPGYA